MQKRVPVTFEWCLRDRFRFRKREVVRCEKQGLAINNPYILNTQYALSWNQSQIAGNQFRCGHERAVQHSGPHLRVEPATVLGLAVELFHMRDVTLSADKGANSLHALDYSLIAEHRQCAPHGCSTCLVLEHQLRLAWEQTVLERAGEDLAAKQVAEPARD